MAYEMGPVWGGALSAYYEMMLERITQLSANPPENWDGIYRATSK
jgi:hypothetical protein